MFCVISGLDIRQGGSIQLKKRKKNTHNIKTNTLHKLYTNQVRDTHTGANVT